MDADPEGIAWIEREAVRTNEFDPDDVQQFWTHALVETVINASCAHSWYNKDVHLPAYHPRAEEQRWNPSGYDAYVRYKYLTTMYGPDKRNTKRIQKIHGNFDYWRMRNPSIIGYIPVSLPTKEERKMYLDLTYPIRAIYFPLAQKAEPRYPTMCKYVRLDFKRLAVKIPLDLTPDEKVFAALARSHQKSFSSGFGFPTLPMGVGPSQDNKDKEAGQDDKDKEAGLNFTPAEEVKSDGPEVETRDQFNSISFDQDVEFGLNYAPKWTIEFDVPDLVILLAIPRKDRNPDDDPYNYLRAINCLDVSTPRIEAKGGNMEDGNYADLQKITKIMQGVSFEYAKSGDDGMFLLNLLNALVVVGLSTCIPGIGPLIACAESLAYDAITNPEKFSADNTADLTKDILGAILDTAKEAKGKVNFGKVQKGVVRNNQKVQMKVTRKAAETYFGKKS